MKDKIRVLQRYRLFQWGLAGIVGAIIYFLLFPRVDLHQYIDASLGEQAASQLAINKAKKLGFIESSTNPQATIRQQSDLIKPVIKSINRDDLHKRLKTSSLDSSILYPWRIGFLKADILSKSTDTSFDEEDEDGPSPDNQRPLQIMLTQKGEWLGLNNHDYYLPNHKTNPDALDAVFPGIKTYIQQETLSDSLVSNLLVFERTSFEEEDDTTAAERTSILKNHLEQRWQFELGKKSALKMVESYLKDSAWRDHSFVLDSAFTTTYRNRMAASLYLKETESFLGSDQDLYLRADILPSGALLSLHPTYRTTQKSSDTLFTKITLISRIVFLIVVIGIILVLFFKRLRDRVIDLKTSLIISILASSLLPALVLMSLIKNGIFTLGIDSLVPLLITTTLAGAFGMFVFFLLVSVGESVARQVWAEKMMSFDLIRSGFVFNRPVGVGVVRSVFASFVLLGLWALMIYLIPSAYAYDSESNIFLYDQFVAAPFFPLLTALLISSLVTLAIFSILGSQIYDLTKKVFWVFPFLFLAFALLDVFPKQLYPTYYEMPIKALLGTVFGYIFLKFGFLTTFLSLFQVVMITSVSTGWIPNSSPDFPIFMMSLLLSTGMLIFGLIAIFKGKPDQHLPNYVPQYVEELARENRIEQELEIAKEVQASFLPRSMPDLKPLDIAAICHPAYETGGDYFDVIKLDDHRVGIAIGDVSGKGIQAAFYMTLAKGIIHSLCHEIDSPRRLLHQANKIFCNNSSKNTFISMIYGVFDTRDNSFCFARAGHNPLLIKRNNETNILELKPKGLGLGITNEDIFYEHLSEQRITLEAGDTIVLFTDGLNEALNRNHTFYGMNRIFELVGQSNTKKASELVVEIEQDISDFMGDSKQHDDLTLVILKVRDSDEEYELNGEYENRQLYTGKKLL